MSSDPGNPGRGDRGNLLSARHSIIIKNPAALEQITTCRTLIFDKTILTTGLTGS
jgi:cation transport ATPase